MKRELSEEVPGVKTDAIRFLGIINEDDLCPLEPEDYDNDRDADGCPDP